MTVLGHQISDDDLDRVTRTVSDQGQGPQRPAPHLARARTKRSPILVELAGLVFLVWIYDWLQDLAPLRQKLAFDHSRSLLSFERGSALTPSEPWTSGWHTSMCWLL